MLPFRLFRWSLALLLTPLLALPSAVAEESPISSEPLLRVEGRLEDSDPTLSEDNTRYDEYSFTGQAGQTITIVLESVEFDSYMLLKNPAGETIQQNDDYTDDNRNSVITFTLLESGTYTIVANAYSAGSRGQYRLTVLAGSEPVFLAAEEQINLLKQRLAEYQAKDDRYKEAETLYKLGEVHRKLDQYREALENYQQALEIYQSLEETSDEAFVLYRIGFVYQEQEQYAQALTQYQQALLRYRAVNNTVAEANMLGSIGLMYRAQGEYLQALNLLEQKLALVRQIPDREMEMSTLYSIGLTYVDYGNSLSNAGSYAESTPLFKQAIDPLQQAQKLAQELDDTATEQNAITILLNAQQGIGFSFSEQNQYSESITAFQEALEILQVYRDRLPESEYLSKQMNILWLLGLRYYYNAQYQDSIQSYENSAQIAVQIGNFAIQAQNLLFIAAAYRNLGDYTNALEASQQRLAIIREQLPEDREAEINALLSLGQSYSALGQYEAASDHYNQGLVIARELGDTDSEISLLNNIGTVYAEQEKYLEAVKSFQKAWEVNQAAIQRLATEGAEAVKQLCGQSFVDLEASGQAGCLEIFENNQALILNNLGGIYQNLGRYSEALEAYQRAIEYAQTERNIAQQMMFLNNIGRLSIETGDYRQALTFLQQALQLAVATNSRPQQAITLNNLGSIFQNQGQYPKAMDYYQQGLAIAREIQDVAIEATILNNIGAIYDAQGSFDQALASYQQAIAASQRLGKNIMTELNNIGSVYRRQGLNTEALNHYQQALEIARKAGSRSGEAILLDNIALLYVDRAEYAKALELQQQGKEIWRKLEGRSSQLSSLQMSSQISWHLGQYDQALQDCQQALNISREIGDKLSEMTALSCLGRVNLEQNNYSQALVFLQSALDLARLIEDLESESRILRVIGSIYNTQGQFADAGKLLEQALKIQREIGIRPDVGITLNHLGLTYASQGKTTEAVNALQQAITIHREVGDRAAEAEALANLGQVSAQQNQPEIAIAFYKQSVNLIEQIRQGLQTLSRDQQESYADTVTERYRTLADLLISQKRFLEAEQVIELLRVQEVYEYSRSTVSASGEISFTPAEQTILKQYQSLIAFAKVFAECNAQANCSEDIYRQQEQLNQEWNALIDELNAAAAARDRRADDEMALGLSSVSSLGSRIVAAQPDTVMIYPVVQDNRLSILWFMPGGISNAIQVEIDQREIAIAVSQFRELMKGCEVSGCTREADIQAIQAVSQRLYSWLMPPQLQTELKQNNIKHLVFALDRFLRYIPMSALYDGNQYLIETYSIATVTAGASTQNNPLPARDQISVLGLGLSESVPADPNRGISQPFSPLNNVPIELASIVRDESDPSTAQGIFRGRELLNPAFDRTALRMATQYPILHIATHGSFDPVNEFNSFLMLGTKEPLIISEIRNYGVTTFGKLSLVVLSACETALGEAERYRDGMIPDGREVTSIAQTFINAGADTIVASLWQVNDPATAALMQQFYANLAANTAEQPVTIAQALQAAQLSLLRGQATNETGVTRSDIIPGGVALSPTSEAITRRYAHPYYWSAFTLIGDGL